MGVLKDAVVENGKQTVDGVSRQHVLFVNMKIRYNGGNVASDNAMFANCTFDLPQTPQGIKVASDVAQAGLK